MRGSCWLSALLSVSYPDAISISLILGKAQALFFTSPSQPRRSEAADAADAVIAASARLTHYESAGFALGGPGSGDHSCNRFLEQVAELALQFVETIRSR